MVATLRDRRDQPGGARRADGRPRVLLRVEKAPAQPGAAGARGRRPRASSTTQGVTAGQGASASTVRAGEIVGIAGVAGNGQSELLEAIAGIRAPSRGRDPARRQADRPAAASPTPRPRGAGLPTCPRTGCAWAWSCRSTASRTRSSATSASAATRGPAFSSTARAISRPAARDEQLRRPPARPATSRPRNFSGGNQQKIVLAREIERDPDLLLVGQPTRGVDIGAIEFIHQPDRGAARRAARRSCSSRSSSTRSCRWPTASW